MCEIIKKKETKEFFDKIASHWDKMCHHAPGKIRFFLDLMDISNGDSILDIGSGTGVLIPYLLEKTNLGLIHEVDISPNMIALAKDKFGINKNINFSILDIESATINQKYQHIFLYSVFPHLKKPVETISLLMHNNLVEGGKLIIAHSDGRKLLNAMHQRKDDAVKNDLLPPIKELKHLFLQANLPVSEYYEDNDIYYLILRKNR